MSHVSCLMPHVLQAVAIQALPQPGLSTTADGGQDGALTGGLDAYGQAGGVRGEIVIGHDHDDDEHQHHQSLLQKIKSKVSDVKAKIEAGIEKVKNSDLAQKIKSKVSDVKDHVKAGIEKVKNSDLAHDVKEDAQQAGHWLHAKGQELKATVADAAKKVGHKLANDARDGKEIVEHNAHQIAGDIKSAIKSAEEHSGQEASGQEASDQEDGSWPAAASAARKN